MATPKVVNVPAHPGNYRKGRAGQDVDKIVVHWIVGRQAAADAVFTRKQPIGQERSAHYSAGPKEIHRYVSEKDTAFANGSWSANLTGISIEHEGGPSIPITEMTYRNSAWLVADIWRRYGRKLPIYPHSKFKATACPGTLDIGKLKKMATAIYEERTMKLTPKQIEKDIEHFLRKPATKADIKRYTGKPRELLLENIAETLRKRDIAHSAKPDVNAGIISKIKGILKVKG